MSEQLKETLSSIIGEIKAIASKKTVTVFRIIPEARRITKGNESQS